MWARTCRLLLLASLAAPAAHASDEASGWDARLGGLQEYRLRATPDPSANEQTLHLGLDLDAAHASRRFLASASLGLWVQTAGPAPFPGPGGAPAGADPSSLAGIFAQKNPWLGVFTLYGEWTPGTLLRLLRVGRQSTEHGRPSTFDGAYALAGTGRLAAFAFAGRTEHFYELPLAGASSTGPFEDWIASAGLQARPGPDVRLEADYRLLREVVTTADAGRAPRVDHSWGGAAWLRAGDAFTGKVALRALGARLAEVGAQAHLSSEALQAGLDARFAAQPVELGELAEQEGPLFATLGPSLPHARWRLDGWKAFAPGPLRLAAHLGWDGRQLLRGEEVPFNRNTSRAFLLLEGGPAALPELSISLGVDRVSTSAVPFLEGTGAQASGLWALDAAARWTSAGGRLRVEAGTDYHQYQYAYLRDVQERAGVRAAWGALRVGLARGLALRARYQVEVFDRVLHTATLGLVQSWEAR